MAAVTSYSRTASNNSSAPPDGAPEGCTAGSINNIIRELMKGIVDEATNNACKVLASVAGTNTITGTLSPDLAAYSAGMIVVLTPANTNTGATTLNIDSLGALDVFNIDGTACVGGELVAGIPAVLVLDSGADDWIIVNPNVLKSRGREVGYLVSDLADFSGSLTLDATHVSDVITYVGSGGHTLTLPSSVLPVGSQVDVYNDGSASLSIAASGTLRWFNGSGSVSTGSRTLAVGGAASLLHSTSTQWKITGTGLT